MQVGATFDSDPRFGSAWLQQTSAQERLDLLTGLLSRFNHDLRTPLNTILGWTHLLQQGAVDAGRSKHVADVIARNSREQTTLLEDFVDDGRAVLGALKPDNRTVSVDAVLAAALERCAPLLSLHAVRLQSHMEVGEISVSADSKRLEKLIYRLLAVVIRRLREDSALHVNATVMENQFILHVAGAANEPQWPEAALLDLRISSMVASVLGGGLEVGADSTAPSLRLSMLAAQD